MVEKNQDTRPIEEAEGAGGAGSGEVLHGGEDDPLGGGVAELREHDEVTEGVPRQDG